MQRIQKISFLFILVFTVMLPFSADAQLFGKTWEIDNEDVLIPTTTLDVAVPRSLIFKQTGNDAMYFGWGYFPNYPNAFTITNLLPTSILIKASTTPGSNVGGAVELQGASMYWNESVEGWDIEGGSIVATMGSANFGGGSVGIAGGYAYTEGKNGGFANVSGGDSYSGTGGNVYIVAGVSTIGTQEQMGDIIFRASLPQTEVEGMGPGDVIFESPQVYIKDVNAGGPSALVLQDETGGCHRITVNQYGALSTATTTCPTSN